MIEEFSALLALFVVFGPLISLLILALLWILRKF